MPYNWFFEDFIHFKVSIVLPNSGLSIAVQMPIFAAKFLACIVRKTVAL